MSSSACWETSLHAQCQQAHGSQGILWQNRRLMDTLKIHRIPASGYKISRDFEDVFMHGHCHTPVIAVVPPVTAVVPHSKWPSFAPEINLSTADSWRLEHFFWMSVGVFDALQLCLAEPAAAMKSDPRGALVAASQTQQVLLTMAFSMFS